MKLKIAGLLLALATSAPAFADYCYYDPHRDTYRCYSSFYEPNVYYRRHYSVNPRTYYYDYAGSNTYYYPDGFGLNVDIVIPRHHHHRRYYVYHYY